jgi:hypothetical protein
LQADGFEEDSGQRWTVLAVGAVQRVDAFEDLGSTVASLPSAPKAISSEQGGVFRLQPVILSGRWIETF